MSAAGTCPWPTDGTIDIEFAGARFGADPNMTISVHWPGGEQPPGTHIFGVAVGAWRRDDEGAIVGAQLLAEVTSGKAPARIEWVAAA